MRCTGPLRPLIEVGAQRRRRIRLSRPRRIRSSSRLPTCREGLVVPARRRPCTAARTRVERRIEPRREGPKSAGADAAVAQQNGVRSVSDVVVRPDLAGRWFRSVRTTSDASRQPMPTSTTGRSAGQSVACSSPRWRAAPRTGGPRLDHRVDDRSARTDTEGASSTHFRPLRAAPARAFQLLGTARPRFCERSAACSVSLDVVTPSIVSGRADSAASTWARSPRGAPRAFSEDAQVLRHVLRRGRLAVEAASRLSSFT